MISNDVNYFIQRVPVNKSKRVTFEYDDYFSRKISSRHNANIFLPIISKF